MPRPILASINTSALKHNLAVVRGYAPHSKVMAVLKANAYGHGVIPVAKALSTADGFATVDIEDAIRLREAGFRHTLLLLNGLFNPRELPLVVEHRLSTVIHSQEQIEMFIGSGLPSKTDIFLKMNTGMNRLGFSPQHFSGALQQLLNSGLVGNVTLMTHFASADEEEGVEEPTQLFFKTIGNRPFAKSLANSAALIRYPETRADWVRPGIMLYGSSPYPDQTAEALTLQPVMTLQSEVMTIQDIQAGDAIGYAKTFVAQKPMRVGVVACGYADGYPRHAPSGTPILVNGLRTTTLGRVAMDMTCVDLTPVPHTRVGDKVTLWGEGLSVDEVAQRAGTVSYELLCAIASRVPMRETGSHSGLI